MGFSAHSNGPWDTGFPDDSLRCRMPLGCDLVQPLAQPDRGQLATWEQGIGHARTFCVRKASTLFHSSDRDPSIVYRLVCGSMQERTTLRD